MRTLVAIMSLCSLALLSSCGKAGSTADAVPDGGLDSRSVDSPGVQDVSSGTDVRLDSAPDMAVDALGGKDTLPGDASTDATAGDDALDNGDADQSDASLSGTCSIGGRPARAGTICRVATGLCDVVEYCDGVSTTCPLDRFKVKDEVCRPLAGTCDHEEACTGTSADCPTDTFLAQGAACRPAVSECDVVEYCDGAGAACPVDTFAPATLVCRPSTDNGVCDPAEYCTGKANQCPADAKYTPPTAAPTGVTVVPGTLLADVAWTAVPGVTGYNVKSSTISGTGFAVRGSSTTSPFTVAPLNATQTFYFAVTAYSGPTTCESPNSAQVSAAYCLATAPTALTATSDGAGHVVLAWTAPSGTVASYSVSRSTTSGAGYVPLPSATALSTTTFTDSPVPSGGGTVYYAVRANTGTCLSPYSTEAAAVIAAADGGTAADAAADAGAVTDDGAADAGTDAAADAAADAVTAADVDVDAVALVDADVDAATD
jgi:hypothetical protein